MRPHPGTPAIILVVLSLMPLTVHGEWITNGVPVCSAVGDQGSPGIASDNVGGCYVVWYDHRNGAAFDTDIYLQRLLADGTVAPGWPVDGFPACHALGRQADSYWIAPDGFGGVLVAWGGDYRDQESNDADVYALRLLPNGQIASGWPVNGVPVSTQAGVQWYPTITGDGTGGAYIVWEDASRSPRELYVQRLLADGSVAPGWPALGQPVCPIPAMRGAPAPLATLENGDLIVAYGDARNAPADPGDIYAVRLTQAGTVAPGWPAEGVPVCRAPGTIGVFGLVLDGSGGFYVAWPDLRTAPANDPFNFDYFDIYVQRLTGSGAVATGWPTNGFPVCTAPHLQQALDVAADGTGGVLMSWSDYRDNSVGAGSDLYVQRVTPAGTIASGWPENGRLACTAPGFQNANAIAGDGSGGAFIAFETYTGVYRVYAQHLTNGGAFAPGWHPDGKLLGPPEGSQYRPDLVEGVPGSAITTWEDLRPGRTLDIYAQRIGADGPTATLVSLMSVEAGVDHVRLVWHSPSGNVVEGSVYRRIDAEDWIALGLGTAPADASGALVFEDQTVTQGVRYAYRLAYRMDEVERFTAETWVDVPLAYRFALDPVKPHPVIDELSVSFSLASAGPAKFEVYDLSGRRVLERVVASTPGTFRLRVPEARALAPGVYWLRLHQGGNVASRRVVVVR